MKLREYQVEAVESVLESWQSLERPLIAVATGGGKTIIISELVKRVLATQAAARFLVIAHTREIINQIYEKIKRNASLKLGEIGIEMSGLKAPPYARVVVATRQTLHSKRLSALVAGRPFTHLLIDEAHHVAPDNQYWKIFRSLRDANPALKVAGFTATPKRSDSKALAVIFTKIAYKWSILSGIDDGFLVPPVRLQIEESSVDLSGLRTRKGDYESIGLNKALRAVNWHELALAAWLKYGEGRKTLAFFSSIELSKAFVTEAEKHGIAAAHIDGKTPKVERERVLLDLKRGALKIVSNMAVLTEGFDEPSVSCILWARPTLSEVVLTQAIGRGLRLHDSKKECLVLDLTPSDTRLLTAGTLLGAADRCHSCGVSFFKGFTKCPKCGAQIIYDTVQRPTDVQEAKPAQRAALALSGSKAEIDGIQVRARHKSLFDESEIAAETHQFFKFQRFDTYFSNVPLGVRGYAAAKQGEWCFVLDPLETWNPDLAARAKAALDSELNLDRQDAKQLVTLIGGYQVLTFRYELVETPELVWLTRYPFVEQALDSQRQAVNRAWRLARQARWWNDPATPKQHGFLRGLLKGYGLTLKVQLRLKGELTEAVNLVKGFGSLVNTLRTLGKRVSS